MRSKYKELWGSEQYLRLQLESKLSAAEAERDKTQAILDAVEIRSKANFARAEKAEAERDAERATHERVIASWKREEEAWEAERDRLREQVRALEEVLRRVQKNLEASLPSSDDKPSRQFAVIREAERMLCAALRDTGGQG